MEKKLIAAYKMGWNPSNNVQKGYVKLMLQCANQPTKDTAEVIVKIGYNPIYSLNCE